MTDTLQFSGALRGWMDTFTHRSMRDWSHYIKASGFSMPQFFLLMHLHHRAHCAISDLSEHMEISNAAASQLVEKLVQASLIERVEDPIDRRAKQISLSPAGQEMVEKGIAERSRWIDDLAANLNAEQRHKVAQALVILTEAAKELEIEK
jgi:DNA-binding MarR family transcriptional regulator